MNKDIKNQIDSILRENCSELGALDSFLTPFFTSELSDKISKWTFIIFEPKTLFFSAIIPAILALIPAVNFDIIFAIFICSYVALRILKFILAKIIR